MGTLFLTALALLSLDEVREPRLTDYLTKVAARVAPDRKLTFTLFEAPIVFQEPRYMRTRFIASAPIEVPISLLRVPQSESEIAAIILHCVAHMGIPPLKSNLNATIPLLVDVSPADPFMPTSLKAVAKERELQADALTVDLLVKAGYDPAAIISLLLKLPTSEFNDEVRRSAARDAIADLQVADDLKVDTSDFAQFRKVLEELPSVQQVRRKSGPPTLRRANEK
jgi:hypothetical protein